MKFIPNYYQHILLQRFIIQLEIDREKKPFKLNFYDNTLKLKCNSLSLQSIIIEEVFKNKYYSSAKQILFIIANRMNLWNILKIYNYKETSMKFVTAGDEIYIIAFASLN